MTEEFTVQGHRISDLAERFGTPMYLYDGDVLRDVYTNLRGRLHPGVDIFYSAKANPNVSICAVLRSLGAGIEVSSLTELITARKAGASPQEIIFLGPGKSAAELDACLEHGIHAIVCESLDELTTLDALKPPADVRVLLRVNPTFTAKGALLSMGGKPRQFGIDEAAVRGSADLLKSLKHIRPSGVHAYMGTRILKAESIIENTRGILAMADELSSALGFPLDTVDIGGGLGVPYFENEKDLDLAETVTGVNAVVDGFLERRPGTRIITELGRYLVGWSGTYVTQARYVKESMGEWFVVADGGTNHHMAAVGIGSFVKRNFPIRSLTRYNEAAVQQYNITGPLCTPNDVVGKSVALPQVRPGDLLGVQRSGAYGPTASPVHFLSHGYPAEVLVLDGEAHLIRSPDTADDLLARQHLISL